LQLGNQALAAAIATAVSRDICVVFSAGNGHWGFPGQHPDVISAGGVYMEPDGDMRASSYSSGFASNIYAGRNVPDLSGLVGMRSPNNNPPGAMYIMLPLEAQSSIDVGQNNNNSNHYRSPGATAPWGDETARNDGWAVFSGTSAAAPQLAGAAALIKQACPRLTPAQIRDILKQTARDVTVGNCSPSTGANPAGPGPDLATGHGLVDAYRAVMLARLRCRTIGPVQPITIQPRQPIGVIQPRQPIVPIQPRQPIVPIQPVLPIQPRGPVPPPIGNEGAAQMDAPAEQGELSAEDRAALEELIISGDLDY
jgi:subtilisin family serine protease